MKQLLSVFFIFTNTLCHAQSYRAQIDSIVHQYDSLGGYNGIIIIAYGRGNISTYEYGYKDPVTKNEKISVTDRFDLASVTKQFAGLAILQLIDKGMIKPEDRIGKYLPELKPAFQKVTIRQLANHTNGIHDFYSLTPDHDKLNNRVVMDLLAPLDTTVFTPGSRWGYSNSGYVLLSQIVGRVSKQSFEDYCVQNILKPLGMKLACFLPCRQPFLSGYTVDNNAIVENVFSSGASGLYASGRDMIAYYKAVSESDAWKKYFSMAYEMAENSNDEGWTYGLGWFFTEDSRGKFRAHSGKNKGADTYVRWYDEQDVFICLLSNRSSSFFKKLRNQVSEFTAANSVTTAKR